MGRSDLIHPESPAPHCCAALWTGYSEQSRAWFPWRNSSPPLGLYDRKWQGGPSVTSVISWEPHQPRAPTSGGFSAYCCCFFRAPSLLAFMGTPEIQFLADNPHPACKKQTMLTGSPLKATQGILAALKRLLLRTLCLKSGAQQTQALQWNEERRNTGGEFGVFKEESVVHLNFTQESVALPGIQSPHWIPIS